MKRTPLNKISEKKKSQIAAERDARTKEYLVFLQIWEERHQRSEISNAWLGDEPRSTFFHHIYPKNKYPEYRYDKDNIIQITFGEHQKVEQSPDFYPEVNKRREALKLKYDMAG